MSKKLISVSLVFFMLLSLFPIGSFAMENNQKVNMEAREKRVVFVVDQKSYEIGGEKFPSDAAPYIKDLNNGTGRTMVPIAFLAPALGTENAQWFPLEQKVLITKGDKEIEIYIGKKEILVNGKKIEMDVAAEIQNIGNGGGRTMLPISIIAKALDITCEWVEATRSVYFYGYTKTYDKKGTFGPATGSELFEGSIVIKADGVILQNMVIKGNLTIAEEVGKGDVTLNNIIVKGDTYIRGGGKDSIHINGGEYNNIIVQNINGKLRIVATNVSGLQVVIAEDAKGEEIILEGNFDKVTIEAEGVKITTQGDTTINTIEIKKEAKGSEINLAKDTVVKEMIIGANVDIQGKGTIEKANIQANNVNLGIKPQSQTVAEGIANPTTNNTTPTIPSSGGGGGGGSPSKVLVNAITVSPETMELTAGGATGTIVATVLPDKATNKNVNWATSDATIATVVNGVVTPKTAGTATITVKTVDGGFSKTVDVTVKAGTEATPIDNGASNPSTVIAV